MKLQSQFDCIIVTGGAGRLGSSYIKHLLDTGFNSEIISLDLAECPHPVTNCVSSITSGECIEMLNNVIDRKRFKKIGFCHFAGIVAESDADGWSTQIQDLSYKTSETCFSLSVISPAKIINNLVSFANLTIVYISSIYGSQFPDFELYRELI